MGKKRSGKKVLGLTHNQRKKLEYAKEREQTWKRRVRKDSSERTWLHVRPCGNPACKECYVRAVGDGIYPIDQKPRLDPRRIV